MKIFLNLDYKAGQFYQNLTTKEEGTTEHKSKNGGVFYRRYYNNIVGTLANFSVADGKFNKELRWTLYDERNNDTYYFSVPLYDARDNIGDVSGLVIRQLPFLEKGDDIECYFYNFENDEGFKVAGVSFKKDGEKVDKVPPKELPRWNKKESAGKVVWDKTDYNNKLYSILEEHLPKLEYDESDIGVFGNNNGVISNKPTSNNTVSKEVEASVSESSTDAEDEFDDELPF